MVFIESREVSRIKGNDGGCISCSTTHPTTDRGGKHAVGTWKNVGGRFGTACSNGQRGCNADQLRYGRGRELPYMHCGRLRLRRSVAAGSERVWRIPGRRIV